MRRTIMSVVGVAAVLALAACGSSGGDGGSPSSSPSASAVALVGPDWGLVSYPASSTGAATKVPASVKADARFSAKSISGSSGCNGYGGSYTTDGSSMTITGVGGTLMFCEGPKGEVESAYLAALEKVTSYAIAGETLTLTTSLKSPLVFERVAPTPLVGTTWQATSLNNGKEGVETVEDPSAVVASFAKDGTVSGNNGCNTFSGPYKTADPSATEGKLTIGPLMSTLVACEDKDTQTQADRFDAAINRVTTYAISGDQLELRDDAGALQVGFTAK